MGIVRGLSAARWRATVAAGLCGATLAAQTPDVAPDSPPAVLSKPIVSSSGRFWIESDDFVAKQRMANWVERMTAQAERALRMPMSFAQRSFRIVVEAPLETAGERMPVIVKGQTVVNGRLVQHLTVRHLSAVDHEELLDALCWLLLNGYVFDRQTPEERVVALGSVPEWLSVGLAQNLDPGLRRRNGRFMLDRMRRGRLPDLTEILAWERVPEGVWGEKAACGLAFSYLASLPDAATGLDRLFRRAGGPDPLTSEWTAAEVFGCATTEELNGRWREWVRRQERMIYDLGVLTWDLLDRLMAELAVSREELGRAAREGQPEDIALADLIPLRHSAEVKALASARYARLMEIGIGAAPELQAVAAAYGSFWEGLIAGRWPFVLRRRLRKADRALEDLNAFVLAGKEYVDRFERMYESGGVGGARANDTNEWARETKDYVDAVEADFYRETGASRRLSPGSVTTERGHP